MKFVGVRWVSRTSDRNGSDCLMRRRRVVGNDIAEGFYKITALKTQNPTADNADDAWACGSAARAIYICPISGKVCSVALTSVMHAPGSPALFIPDNGI